MLNKGSLFTPKREPGQPAAINTPTPAKSPTPMGPLPLTPASAAVAGGQGTAPARENPPTAPAAAKAADETLPGAKLVVGPGVKLKGAEIQDCDTLVVEGRVEATMDSRYIEIADRGSFDGKVNIDIAEIHGRFAGELTAREQIVIYSTGHVSGKIRYGRIVIHEGGEISGDIRALSAGEVPANDDLDSSVARMLAARTA